MNHKESYFVFTLNGKELFRYVVEGTTLGDLIATKEMLASENNCSTEEINAHVERI